MECGCERYKYISTLDALYDAGKTYMVDRNDNGLYVLDETSGEICFKVHLGSTGKNTVAEFTFTLLNEGKFYALPQNSFFIAIYDIKTKVLRRVKLPYDDEEWGFGAIGGFFRGQWLYVISGLKKFCPVRVNIDSLQIEILHDFGDSLKLLPTSEEFRCMGAFALDGANIYFGVYGTNRIYSGFLESGDLREVIRLKDDFNVKALVMCSNGKILASSVDANILAVLDLSDKTVKYYALDVWNVDTEAVRLITTEKYVWLIPRFGVKIIRYDVFKDSFNELIYDYKALPDECHEYERVFYGCDERKGILYLYRYGKNGRVAINVRSGETVFQSLDKEESKDWKQILTDNFWEYVDIAAIEAADSINEGLYHLPMFVDRIPAVNNSYVIDGIGAGRKIWEKVRGD